MQNKDNRYTPDKAAPVPADDTREASLVEALQRLTEDMAKAESDADAQQGLQRLKQIRAAFLGGDGETGAGSPVRRNAQALIDWVEARLEQLHQQLARKRRIQEGESMEIIAKQREEEAPSLLPTELIDAVVRSTTEAEKDRSAEDGASQAPSPEIRTPGKKRAAEDRREKKRAAEDRREKKRAEEDQREKQQAPEIKPAEKKPPESRPAEKKPAEPTAAVQDAARRKPEENRAGAEKPAPAQKSEWTSFERLAAHMAASVREDPGFFEKLRRAAKQNGPKAQAPADHAEAEAHYRAVHDLGRRLVNMELHVNALARAEQKKEPGSALLRSAARELKLFFRDLKANQQARPELAEEYERLFGGWARQFRSIRPEKGGDLLAKCRGERQPGPQAAPMEEPEPRAAEAEAPQLVLKRPDDWQQ